MKEKFKARKKVIELERQQILQEKIQETERKKEARLKKVENYTNQVLIWGLWQTEDEVDQALLRLKTKQRQTRSNHNTVELSKTRIKTNR